MANARSWNGMALRTVLALTGLGVVALGLNIGLGGILTLGWQGPTDFATVADPAAFAVQDNHVRFVGGVWLGVGLCLLAGAVALKPMRPVLYAVAALVVVGGLARLSAQDPELLTSLSVAPSLAFELVGFPLLAFWIARTGAET